MVRYNFRTLEAMLQEERRKVCKWVGIASAEVSLDLISARKAAATNAAPWRETMNGGAEMLMTEKRENEKAMADGRHAKEAVEKTR